MDGLSLTSSGALRQTSVMRAKSLRTRATSAQRSPLDDACLAAFEERLGFVRGAFRSFGVAADDVDDLVQDFFIVLRSVWHQYDPERDLRPYLFGIAFRIAAAHQRKRKREVPAGLLRSTEDVPAPDELVQLRERYALLSAILGRVPAPRRAVLVRHELEGAPMAEVAAELSIPLFTTYSRLRKARRELEAAARYLLRSLLTSAGGP
jgi:RNA polymerase sigma-70 factor (ECF subfamily)